MDGTRFDRIVQILSRKIPRRRVLEGIVGVGVAHLVALAPLPTAARKRTKRRRICDCASADVATCVSQRKKKKKANRILRTNPCAYRGQCRGISGCSAPDSCTPTESLGAAIGAAEPGATIRVCPGTWTLTGLGATLRITKNLTLIGAGPGQTILDGSGLAGIFRRVLRIESGSTVTIQGMTITKGSAESGGGGILNLGMLTLLDVTVTDNDDGGIYNAGMLALKNSSVTGNTGGGIYNWGGGHVRLMGSSVTGNKADYGGGILNTSSGTVTLDPASSVTGNTADTGGGIYNLGTLTLEAGSRVTGNIASSSGGGISNDVFEGEGGVTIDPGAVVCGNIPDDCAGDPVIGTCPQLPPSGVCPV